MNFELKTLSTAAAAREKCDLLLMVVTQSSAKGNDALSSVVAHAIRQGDFDAAAGKQLAMYQLPAVAARRVVLLGAGAGSAREVRNGLAGAAAALKAEGVKKAVVCFAFEVRPAQVRAALLAIADIGYSYSHTKSQAKPVSLAQVVIGVESRGGISEEFAKAQAQVQGMELAREWANRPANHATPSMLAQVARGLAKKSGISCRIHGPAEVAKLGMGAFLAVAQGSREPLRFIELHYNGADKSMAPIVLVGKGITFDTGGISLKPAAEMDEMKFDMSGAASVLGLFEALAVLQPKVNVIGLIPACENMPGGGAVKPGDVVRTMSGQTVEVLNTDAEGRLVLCDVLHYAARFQPAAMVDIATLTGACVVALGAVRSGLFASDEELAAALAAAGDTAMDLCWRMPLDDEYAEGLKSNFADMGNVAGRAAGAVTAAKFLQKFVGDTPWAHLDIAGTAWKSGAAKGATGRPVGLLLEYVLAARPVTLAPKAGRGAAAVKKAAAKGAGRRAA